jgi:hypothetical protein
MALCRQQPVVPRPLDQPATGLHRPLAQAGQGPVSCRSSLTAPGPKGTRAKGLPLGTEPMEACVPRCKSGVYPCQFSPCRPVGFRLLLSVSRKSHV